MDADLAARVADLERDFQLRLSDVEKVLLDFERRGNAFFDERLRLMRIHELLSRERLRKDFEPIGVRVEQLTAAVEVDAFEEELLTEESELQKMWVLRKVLHPMDELAAIEFLLNKLQDTKTNAQFFEAMKR